MKLKVGIIALLVFLVQCVSASKYEALEKQYQESQQTVATKEQEITTLNESLVTTQKERDALSEEKTALEKRLKELEAQLKKTEGELAGVKQERSKLTSDNQTLSKQLSEREKQLKSELDNLKKEIAALQSKQAATNRGTTTTSQKEVASAEASYKALVDSLEKELKQGDISIARVENQIHVTVDERVFFDSGSALLRVDARDVLRRIAGVLGKLENKTVFVEGHTDDREIGQNLRSRYPTNWELSSARAVSVVRFLVEEGSMDPSRLAAVSLSRWHPVASNETAEGRQKNRRIEIMIVEKRGESKAGPSGEPAAGQ